MDSLIAVIAVKTISKITCTLAHSNQSLATITMGQTPQPMGT